MNRLSRVLIALALCGAGALFAAPGVPMQPDPLYGRIARTVARMLPDAHLERPAFDENLSTNALALYINALDFDHSFFLAADIEQFRKEGPALADRMKRGDLSFAYAAFARFQQRVSNRVEYVRGLLDQPIDVTVKETYAWKRREAAWPVTEAEWNDLWRRKVKNEYVSQLVSKRIAEENGRKGAATNSVAVTNAPADAPKETAAASNAPALAAPPVPTPQESIYKRYKQFLTVIQDSDAEWVLQRYLSAWAQACDPHSDYMAPSTAEDFDIGMKLSLVGIGALLGTEDGAAKVERIIPGGPAARDGRLKDGDKIIGVAQGDGEMEDILHWPLRKIVEKIRGEKGTRVVLAVIPAAGASGGRTVRIDIVRDEVKLEEQAAQARVRDVTGSDGATRRMGVLSLPTFYADMSGRMGNGDGDFRSSTRDVRRLLGELAASNAVALVLDLRNNGGGSLAEAIEMTGLFIAAGPVVQVRERRGVQVLSDPDFSVAWRRPIIVLVNHQSASASEILAAALQDYGRAVIVGDAKTHGKGTVQSLVPLDRRDEALGSLKITAAKFYRIAGGSTQLRGVTPDIVIPSALDALEIGEEHLPNALAWSAVEPAPYRPIADIREAVPLLRARSAARRADSPRFAAERELIERVAAMQQAKTISLNLQDRIDMAREERRLADLEKEVDEDGGGPKNMDADLVLLETFQILSDMIELQKASERAPAP